jgi:glycosyltransferase involved in cell wall biosynthesis
MSNNLLVFSDDWGRHPSSCQHLIRQMLQRHNVLWVNTIGTRPPRLDLATVRRGFEKIRHWTKKGSSGPSLPAGLHVCNPKMWPWFGSRFDRWLNRGLLGLQLKKRLGKDQDAPIAITTLPIVADLMDALPVRRWVYYCVDDFGEWPGLDGETLRRMESAVVKRADKIIAVSQNLKNRLMEMGRSAELLTHGADPAFWSNPGPSKHLPQLENLERPLVVFWGVLDRRLDVTWLKCLAERLSQGTLVLAGPLADPDPAIFHLPRTVRLGSLPFEDLPGLARAAAVLIMPYADLQVTRMIQPLKLKEYLMTGKPVVGRDLPATREWQDCADVVQSAEEFVQTVLSRLNGLPEYQAKARARLQKESWTDKTRLFESWVLGEDSALGACG